MAQARLEMSQALERVLKTGAYSDLVIKCGAREFNVHKVIVCSRSSYFEAACKPERFKEGEEGIIELAASDDDKDVSADDPEAVRMMIDWLYTSEYRAPILPFDHVKAKGSKAPPFSFGASPTPGSQPPSRGSQPPPDINGATSPPTSSGRARTFATPTPRFGSSGRGNRTGVPAHAAPSFGRSFGSGPDQPALSSPAFDFAIDFNIIMHAKVYALGAKYDIPSLKRAAQEKFDKAIGSTWNGPVFARAIRLVFSTTMDEDNGLRDKVVQTLQDDMNALSSDPEVEAAIMSIDKLGYRLWKGRRMAASTSPWPNDERHGRTWVQC